MEPAATETNAPKIAPEEDSEAKVALLQAEIAKVSTEKENYRTAYLKEVEKSDLSADEKEEARMRRIAQEELANSNLARLSQEKDEIIRKTLKENKELKLAQMNKEGTTPPAGMGGHSEGTPVKDTLVTPDQLAAFKARGWSDKDIEQYKKNLTQRSTGR